mgnify:CR=1 FL=1
MENKHEILLGLTTTPNSDWKGKVEEMKKFGIKKIALFPTFLPIEKRKEFENNLSRNVELLKTLLANLPSGIKVEDEIITYKKS